MPYADSDYERSWKMQTKGVTLYPVKPGPHTPGPWYCHVQTAVAEEADGDYGDATCITTADADSYSRTGNRGDVIAWVPHDRKHGPNARLIAAAPELLHACRCALADMKGIMPEFDADLNDHPGWRTIQELQDAIDKAEGRE